MFDAIWLVHYLRLWSNTHLLLWSENVENRSKKTGVNSRFRSKNLRNKSPSCTWKYLKKHPSKGNTALGNCFCLENQSTEKLFTCILQQIVDVNGYECQSNFLTVEGKIKPKRYFLTNWSPFLSLKIFQPKLWIYFWNLLEVRAVLFQSPQTLTNNRSNFKLSSTYEAEKLYMQDAFTHESCYKEHLF